MFREPTTEDSGAYNCSAVYDNIDRLSTGVELVFYRKYILLFPFLDLCLFVGLIIIKYINVFQVYKAKLCECNCI